MTLHTLRLRAPLRAPIEPTHVSQDRSLAYVLWLLLFLVFAPMIGVHVAFVLFPERGTGPGGPGQPSRQARLSRTTMIRVYDCDRNSHEALTAGALTSLPKSGVWIDLDRPSDEEEQALERLLKLDLPTADEMKDIEPSSRLYVENGATYMTAGVLWGVDIGAPEVTPITFVLSNGRLITIRYAEPRTFKTVAAYIQTQPDLCSSGVKTLITLLEGIIDRTAEVLEKVGTSVDQVAKEILERKRRAKRKMASTKGLEEALDAISVDHNVTVKARESLVSLGRMIGFLALTEQVRTNKEAREHVKSLARDAASLTDHATFIASNINFLLDASLGLINLEQNQIIKIFSVAAVCLMPPTLVASSYGMNFEHMPELRWLLGYPYALGLMVISAIIPFVYFKRKVGYRRHPWPPNMPARWARTPIVRPWSRSP
jgi:magnesium transporter